MVYETNAAPTSKHHPTTPSPMLCLYMCVYTSIFSFYVYLCVRKAAAESVLPKCSLNFYFGGDNMIGGKIR